MWKDFVLAEKVINRKPLLLLIIFAIILINIVHLGDTSLIDWDEGVFALQSQWFASLGDQGKPFNFQTPPLYQLLLAGSFKIFGYKTFVLHLIALVASCIGTFIVFRLSKMLFTQQDAIIATILFASTEFFLFFSRSGLSDAVFLCFFLASILFFFRGLKLNINSQFLYAGLFLVLASYTKYSAFPLFISYLIIGLLHKKSLKAKWFFYSIVLPVLLILPYFLLLIKFVPLRELSTRHISFLGINHIKFLFYILIFAPIPFLFTVLYIIFNVRNIKKWDIYFIILLAIFIFILGFYYPYFRLAYPLIPLFSIIAYRFVNQTKQYKPYIIAASVMISLILSAKTVTYKSNVPERIGEFVNNYVKQNDIKYIYTVVPPNIDFYIDGSIAIPEGHQWLTIGNRFPRFLKNRKIIYREENELLEEEKILLVHATTFDTIKHDNSSLYDLGIKLASVEFIDAPVYYKDIYNPERAIRQIYEVYIFETEKLSKVIDDLWALGFNRKVHVRYLDIQ